MSNPNTLACPILRSRPRCWSVGKEVFREFFYDAWEMTSSEYKDEFLERVFRTMFRLKFSFVKRAKG